MTDSEQDLVTGGNVVDPKQSRARQQAQLRKRLALYCYPIVGVYLLFWVAALVSTIMHGFLQFDFGVLIIGMYSAVSLIFVARAAVHS